MVTTVYPDPPPHDGHDYDWRTRHQPGPTPDALFMLWVVDLKKTQLCSEAEVPPGSSVHLPREGHDMPIFLQNLVAFKKPSLRET